MKMNSELHCINLFTDDMAGKTFEPAKIKAKKDLKLDNPTNVPGVEQKLSNLSFNTA